MKERWEASEWNPPVFLWSSGVLVSVILYSWVRNRESLFQVVCWTLVSLISAAPCYFAYRTDLSNEATTSFPVVMSHKEGTTHLCFTTLSFHKNPRQTHTHIRSLHFSVCGWAFGLQSHIWYAMVVSLSKHTYIQHTGPKGMYLKNSIRWLNICCSKTNKKEDRGKESPYRTGKKTLPQDTSPQIQLPNFK